MPSRDTDIAWLVGLLEGEGCFYGRKNGPYVYAGIMVGSTDKDVIDRVARLLEANITIQPISSNPDKVVKSRKVMYRVDIWSHKAEEWMERLYPFMSSRRKGQILEALHSARTSRASLTRPNKRSLSPRVENSSVYDIDAVDIDGKVTH